MFLADIALQHHSTGTRACHGGSCWSGALGVKDFASRRIVPVVTDAEQRRDSHLIIVWASHQRGFPDGITGIPDNGKPAAKPGRKATGPPGNQGGSGATEGRPKMFASTARSRQPCFSSRRQRAEKQLRFTSFMSGLVAIWIATWAGFYLAQYISDHSTIDNSVAHFVNGLIRDVSQINPV